MNFPFKTMDRRKFLKYSGIGLCSTVLGAGGYLITDCRNHRFKDDGSRLCGTNLVTWEREGFYSVNNILEKLIGLTNHISLVTSYSMNTIYSKRIKEDINTPSLGSLEFAISRIRNIGGIKTMLKPHINVKKGARTLVYPTQEFYQMYFEDFIYPMAEFAQKNSVDQFCIGTELMLAAAINPSVFEKGIKGVRKRFGGEITFASFNSTAHIIDFWDALDFIGYNHYQSIIEPNPSIGQIENAFKQTINSLEALAKKYSKKILFTEYGCTSLDGGSFMPSTPERRRIRKKVLDCREQNDYLKGFYNSFWEEKWCLGGDLWCAYNPEEVSEETRQFDYYWLDKPVETTITQRYSTNAREGLKF